MHSYDLMIRPALCLLIALAVTCHADEGQSAFPVAATPKPLMPLMQRELRGCFDFFWREWVSAPASPTYGMTAGDYVGMGLYPPIPEGFRRGQSHFPCGKIGTVPKLFMYEF